MKNEKSDNIEGKATAPVSVDTPIVSTMIVDSFSSLFGLNDDTGPIDMREFTVTESNSTFKRVHLFDQIRSAKTPFNELKIQDKHGSFQTFKLFQDKNNEPSFVLAKNDVFYDISMLITLLQDKNLRIQYLNGLTKKYFLSRGTYVSWLNELSKNPLSNTKFDDFYKVVRNSPNEIGTIISYEFHLGNSDINTLVPKSVGYFENLVGKYSGENNLKEFSEQNHVEHIQALLEWNNFQGLLLGLHTSSHSLLTSIFDIKKIGITNFFDALNSLLESGDRVSQLGAIEISLRNLKFFDKEDTVATPLIGQLIEEIYVDNPSDKKSGFNMLSSLFVLVDGELSKSNIFSDFPVFYRRLASISQASLIVRQLYAQVKNATDFCEWAYNVRLPKFQLKNLCDMRIDPRWNPRFVQAQALKEYAIERIRIAAKNVNLNERNPILYELIQNHNTIKELNLSNPKRLFLPGPLDGKEFLSDKLPTEVKEYFESMDKSMELSDDKFTELIYFTLKFESNNSKIVYSSAKFESFINGKFGSKEDLDWVLDQLSIFAAVTRNTELARLLLKFCGNARSNQILNLDINLEFNLCLVAAASHQKLDDWSRFIGSWVEQLAFQKKLSVEDAKYLEKCIRTTCEISPELWKTCGRGLAALSTISKN